jgi:hypothetical protein
LEGGCRLGREIKVLEIGLRNYLGNVFDHAADLDYVFVVLRFLVVRMTVLPRVVLAANPSFRQSAQ